MEPAGRGRVERRLAAILAADVAGYSRLISADEGGTLERLRALRRELLDPKIAEHKGRLVKTTGDGLLVEFGSVVDALRCAVEVQREVNERNTRVLPDRRIELRIGINVGDVVVEDGDIFGDGVNVAARLEGLAESGGICVAARVQEDAAGKLDLAFDDLGEQQLKNIARPVRAYRVVTEARPPAKPQASAGPALDKPSIAVLPFQNLRGDPEQEYFADGIVEDIITALSRVGWFFVIARNSSFTYKGKTVDIKQVGRELGVRYVLEGSIRKAANRVRITGQLIEAVTGHHIWADRFEGALGDIFDLQDRITESVVGAITPSLRRAEISRAYAKPTDSLDAYDLYLRALERHYTRQPSASDTAVALLERAIQIDPDYALARALLGDVYAWRYAAGWGDQEAERASAIKLAREAIASNRDDPDTLRYAAHAISYFAHEYEVALSTLDRALRLNPNSAQILTIAGWVHLHALSRLFVEPSVFHAPAVVDAIDHDREALDIGLPAGPRTGIKDDRPGAVLGQFAFDLPDQVAPLLLIGLKRLAVDHLVNFRVAIAGEVLLGAAGVADIEIAVGVVEPAAGEAQCKRIIPARQPGEPLGGIDRLDFDVEIDFL
jgi:adenylate cyclase